MQESRSNRRVLTLAAVTVAMAVVCVLMVRARRGDSGGSGVPALTAQPVATDAGRTVPRRAPAVTQPVMTQPAMTVAPFDVENDAGPDEVKALPQAAAVAVGKGLPERRVRRVEVIPGMSTNPPPPTGFSSQTEALINMIVNTPLGSPPPPLPRVPPREDFAKIFETDILVYDEDDEQTVAAKINVAKAKEYLKEYLEQGGTPDGFLTYYHDELRAAHQEWMLARKQALDLIKAGDEELAARYVEAQNKVFAERGIKAIFAPGAGGPGR